jgi:hypothetical protein
LAGNYGRGHGVYPDHTKEDAMGIFRRNRDIAITPADPASTLGSRDVVPSDIGNRITARGNAMLGKATQFYKENPKLVGGAALIASALLLNKMRTPRAR